MTSHQFLSDEWFSEVSNLVESSELELPEKLRDLVLNVVISDTAEDGSTSQITAIYRGCWFAPGIADDAAATLLTTRDLAYEVMIKKNIPLGVRALSTGKAKVKGDRRKLLALRAVRPSPSQAALEAKVAEMTAL